MIDVLLTHKIGFIGYGNHARKLLNIVQNNHNFEISHIYHPSKNMDDLSFTNKLEDLYDCDAIIISSPNNTHFEYIKKIIENSNSMIYCEKPPVTSLDGIRYLEKMTDEEKKRIFFNFNLRFSKLDNIFKESLNSGKLGKIIQINIIISQGLAFKEKYLSDWRSDGKNNLHNIIENVAIHWIDLLVYNFGKISKIDHSPRLISNNGTSYDTNSVHLQFESGTAASIFTSYATPLIENIVIIGTDGLIILKDGEMNFSYPRDTFDENGLFTEPKNSDKNEFNFRLNAKDSIKESLNYFLERIENSSKFDIDYFNTCLYSNKLILELEKIKNNKNEY